MARDELQQAEHDADVESDGEGEGEDATETTALLSAKRERRQAATAKAIASALDHTAQARAMSIDPLTPSSAFDETLRDHLRGQRAEGEAVEDEDEDEEEGDEEQRLVRTAAQRALGEGPSEGNENGANGEDRVLDRSWRAPPGKRIAVPVRIEPKVYFAVERTFFVSPSSSPSCYLRTPRQTTTTGGGDG